MSRTESAISIPERAAKKLRKKLSQSAGEGAPSGRSRVVGKVAGALPKRRALDDIARVASGGVHLLSQTRSHIRDEVKSHIRQALARMDLVTADEYRTLLARVEALEAVQKETAQKPKKKAPKAPKSKK